MRSLRLNASRLAQDEDPAAKRRFNWVIGTIVGMWLTMMATQITTILTIVSHR